MTESFDLYPWQVEGRQHLTTHKRTLIPLPGGTGKSVIPLMSSKDLGVKSITVLCSGNALYTWVKNIKQHRPDLAASMVVLEKMNGAQRELYWNNPNVKVIISTARSFWRDWPKVNIAPGMLILDEPQKFMRNEKSKTCEAITELAQSCKYVAVLTGSPVSRGRQNLYPILYLLQPRKYKSKWKFVNEFCYVVRGMFGMEIAGPRNTPKFEMLTGPEIYRPSMPLEGLPEIIRAAIPIEMQPRQAEFYKRMEENMLSELSSGEFLIASSVLAKVTRLRQILVCPKILDPDFPEYGAGIEAALDHMQEDEENEHCVWFTPFTDAIPYMQQALFNQGFEQQVVFQHGMTSSDLKNGEEFFRSHAKSVAICSIMFAQSYELETGNPAHFIGYSFDPEDNKQAEWRLRRLTTQRAVVNARYYQNLGTYDDRQLAILSTKTLNTRVDMNSMHHVRQFLGVSDK